MAVSISCDFLDEKILRWDFSAPLFIGINGPQGSGKLYLADHLLEHLHQKFPDLTSVGVLIDDFYLTNSDQRKVTAIAKQNDNKLLQGRGLPGTHDLPLAIEVLTGLSERKAPVFIPIYDKSAFSGEGDRASLCDWQKVANPADVVIFEGWFNGYKSISEQAFTSVYMSEEPSGIVQSHSLHHMEAINDDLAKYEQLWEFFDFFIYFKTDTLDNVYLWRQQQEDSLIRQKGSGMTPKEVRAFVDRYMPMYCLYYERMCGERVAGRNRNLEIEIDVARNVKSTRIK